MDDVTSERRAAGRALQALRSVKTGACTVCGKPWTSVKPRLYCSVHCQMKAFRARHPKEKAPTK